MYRIHYFVYILAVAFPVLSTEADDRVDNYPYRIVETYPHSPKLFTQGLEFYDGFLYESAGQYGASQLIKRRLQTDTPILSTAMERSVFGEGITLLGSRVFQLSWKSRRGFLYDAQSLRLLGEFSYQGEGWGLCNNGREIIMSDGSDKLRFIDPNNFSEKRRVSVTIDGLPLTQINELEWVDGYIYANVWQTERIYIINPDSGVVTATIDLSGLVAEQSRSRGAGVLNGIAYDPITRRLFVTGKYWSTLYQITVTTPTNSGHNTPIQ